ncbi:MAG: ATP-binding protein, partial [Caldisericia bacterium]|nr:ATP-binding protein [Caldisericia bacterium]
MIFSKPFDELTFEDIKKLTDTNTAESLILDYKKEIIGDERSKKEILKDVSSMANSSGGYIIIGIEENKENGYPIKPFFGTNRIINNQKVEEWLEQIIRSNIQPNIIFRIKALPLPNNDEKCLVIINVHMVIYNGDNRYYIRHNTQSTPANYYEIEELFERRKKMEDRIDKFLIEKNYKDVNSNNFCQNELTKNLVDFDDFNKPAESSVIFLSIPEFFIEKVNFLSDEVRSFLNDSHHYNPPSMDPFFIPHDYRTTFKGRLYFKTHNLSPIKNKYIRFLHLNEDGFVEYGLSDIYMIPNDDKYTKKWFYRKKTLSFAKIIGFFWQF